MLLVDLLNRLPMWGVFLLTVCLCYAAVELGIAIGAARRRRAEQAQQEPLAAVVAAILGLLAFMLSFTFGGAAARFDLRRHLLLDEVNAIGTASLRAGLLAEPHRSEVRRLLREYVDLRVDLYQHPERLAEVVRRTEQVQDEIWAHARALVEEDRGSPIYAIFIESLNQTFDLQTSRLTVARHYRVPAAIWQVLYLLAAVSMVAVGYQFGLMGKRNVPASLILAVAFSCVMLLIVDIDRPLEGALRISQQPMIELQQKLHAATP